MPDDRVTTLLRHLDVDVRPDPDFAAVLLADLLPIVRAARSRGAGARGFDVMFGLWRWSKWTTRLALVAGLLLALAIAAAAFLGSKPEPAPPLLLLSSDTSQGVAILDPGATGPRLLPLMDEAGGASISPSGDFVAIGANDITVLPLPAGAAIHYQPRAYGAPAWSSRGELAWVGVDVPTDGSSIGPSRTVYAAHPGQAGVRSWSAASDEIAESVSFSPDGQTVAVEVSSPRDCGFWHIVLLDPASLTPRVEVPGIIYAYEWAPDGSRLVISTVDPATCENTPGPLVAIGVNSTAVEPLGQIGLPIGWTRDGWIVFETSPDTGGTIWRVRPDGTEVSTILSTTGEPGSVSADGKQLLLFEQSKGVTGPGVVDAGGIWTASAVSLATGARTTLLDGIWRTDASTWSPDGTWVALVRAPIVSAAQRHSLVGHVWLVRSDGTDAHLVADGYTTVGVRRDTP